MISPQRVAVLILDGDHILLIHRYKRGREYYVIPGGTVEPNESLEQTACREIKEETSLDIELERKLWSYNNQGRLEHYFLTTTFSGVLELGGPESEYQSSENIFQLEWTPLIRLPDIPLLPEFIKQKTIDEIGPRFNNVGGLDLTKPG